MNPDRGGDVVVDGRTLSLADVRRVAVQGARVVAGEGVIARLAKARVLVETMAAGNEPHYGINTGFGALAEVIIPADKVGLLQKNLIESHAVGVGAPLSFAEARALMLLRANTLAVGHSGCRPVVLESLLALLNAGCAPLVPRKGSVGASGDLAPLAHTAMLLLGQGNALVDGAERSAGEALAKAQIAPIVSTLR